MSALKCQSATCAGATSVFGRDQSAPVRGFPSAFQSGQVVFAAAFAARAVT